MILLNKQIKLKQSMILFKNSLVNALSMIFLACVLFKFPPNKRFETKKSRDKNFYKQILQNI